METSFAQYKLGEIKDGLLRWLSGKESACNARDKGLIPGSRRALEKEMATHSSVLAWKIPWTEDPGRLHTAHGVTKESGTT